MGKKIILSVLSFLLLSLSAFASTVFVIDSTFNNHGGKIADIIRQQAPYADVKFIPISNGPQISNFDLLKAIYGLIEKVNTDPTLKGEGVVLNLSLGSSYYSRAIDDAISAAQKAGIVVVAAAGNDYGMSTSYPAALPGVVSVGALERNPFAGTYQKADYSNYGKVWAPTQYAGTSFASPYVAGQIARAMDEKHISAFNAKDLVLNNAFRNNNVVGATAVSVQDPFKFSEPKQVLPDEKIFYELFAMAVFTRLIMESIFDNIFSDLIFNTSPLDGFVYNRTKNVVPEFSGFSSDNEFSFSSPVVPFVFDSFLGGF